MLARPARAVLLAGVVLTAGCSARTPPDARAPREPTARLRRAGAGDGEVVADGSDTERYDVLEFDPVMGYGADYRVVVRVDGHVAWNRTVSRAEG